jgi:hypothetical protein
MKKLILAVSLLMANMVQASDTPTHPFDTRPTYRFHIYQRGLHFPPHLHPGVFHGVHAFHQFPVSLRAAVRISMPDFKTADEEMIVGTKETVLIKMPDFAQADLEMML